MNDLKVGTYVPNYNVKDLHLDSTVNRETSISNIEEKKNKLEENNWLMPIVITTTGKVLEGQNRLLASVSLSLKTIPVYIVDWINDEDVDEVRDVIISLNNGNKAWTQWDYIKSYKANNKNYREAYNYCMKYDGVLSNGNVVNALFGIGAMNERFKKGDSVVRDTQKYVYLLETCSSLVTTYGKNQFPSQTLRTFILWANNKDYDIINYIVNEMKVSVKHGTRISDGDLGLRDWLTEKVNIYESIANRK